jgi:hypothetical protein
VKRGRRPGVLHVHYRQCRGGRAGMASLCEVVCRNDAASHTQQHVGYTGAGCTYTCYWLCPHVEDSFVVFCAEGSFMLTGGSAKHAECCWMPHSAATCCCTFQPSLPKGMWHVTVAIQTHMQDQPTDQLLTNARTVCCVCVCVPVMLHAAGMPAAQPALPLHAWHGPQLPCYYAYWACT